MVFDGIRNALARFLKGGDYEKSVEEFMREFQKELVKADVNLKLAMELSSRIKERALKSEPPPGVSRREWFITIVYEELTKLLGGERKPIIKPPRKPWVIMLVGLQGSGKTTTAAKLAYLYKLEGYSVGLVAADTFRPAAYTQLKQLGDHIGVPVYGEPGSSDAVAVAVKGVEFFKERRYDLIIIDTAGRHHRDEDLLEEMKAISESVKPDEIILVLDAAVGQQAYNIARKFHESTPIGSIIVTKLDGTAKGGGALSAVAATGALIKFIGTGEKIDELEVFNPPRFVSRILGLGDVEGLVERVRRLQADFTEEDVKKLVEGKVNMRLVYKQLVSLRKMGPLAKILQMIPGLGVRMPLDVNPKELESKINKWLAVINSMTYEELDNPDIIDRSRIKRIARGAGVEVEDVRELLRQYELMKKLSKQLRRKEVLKKLGLKLEDLKIEAEE
ncbi:MAG: signal recognition particle protein Srp54 [Desulfurococcus sp.]|nr:signal recognition particle protein Srp54 [Desulfurococcus sp.]